MVSDAQGIDLVVPEINQIIPTFKKIDDTHAQLSWNSVEGADAYYVTILNREETATEDGID